MFRKRTAVRIVKFDVIVSIQCKEIQIFILGISTHDIGTGIITQFLIFTVNCQFSIFPLDRGIAYYRMSVEPYHSAEITFIGICLGAVKTGYIIINKLELGVII